MGFFGVEFVIYAVFGHWPWVFGLRDGIENSLALRTRTRKRVSGAWVRAGCIMNTPTINPEELRPKT